MCISAEDTNMACETFGVCWLDLHRRVLLATMDFIAHVQSFSHSYLPNLPCHPSSPVLQTIGVGSAVLEVGVGMIGALP